MPKKPVFGTSEWASHNVNIFNGCQHDCQYCYAKASAIRYKRATPESWSSPILNAKALAAKRGKKQGTIMFPTTHDIHPDNLDDCIVVLEKMLNAGNNVLIVTKPHLLCIDTITSFMEVYKPQILFRFTIGSPRSSVLKFWEPNAPSFEERFEALKLAFSKGFQTSISSEPMLDEDVNMISLFDQCEEYVTNTHWMGKANDLINRLRNNGINDNNTIKKAQNLISYWNDPRVKTFYKSLKNEPKIRWKESIKKVVGLEIPTTKGLDI